jgi:hypothetical protein
MSFFPYRRVHIKSELSPDAVKDVLSKIVAKPSWGVSIDKVFNNRVLEGKIGSRSFTVVMGRYGLTYGITSLLPVLKGKIKNNGLQGSEVDVTIRPLKAGIFILSFFYLLVALGLYFSLAKGLPQVFIVCCIFIAITYYSLITKFNREAKGYIEIMNNYLAPASM